MKAAWLLPVALLAALPLDADARRRRRRGGSGTVIVQSTTAGAQIFIDGKAVAEVPMKLPLALRAGEHTIRVTKPGYADYLDTFRVRRRKDEVLAIDLLAVAGVLRIDANPQGQVVVDGRQIGETPFEGELEPGERKVEVRSPGRSVFKKTLKIVAGEVFVLEVTLVPLPPREPAVATPWYGEWWVWAGAAAVVAVGVTSAVVLSADEGPPPEPDHIADIELSP